MRIATWLLPGLLTLAMAGPAPSADLTEYFPPPESQGGWRTFLPESGAPDDSAKARIKAEAGVDWDKLEEAWQFNAAAPGATGLVVIRKGQVVGEWYRGGDRASAYNIYSSSKAYTSTAFGLILADFGNGPLPDGRSLSLDTKVCNAEWIPESLPLPDPRKAEMTVRHLLNMASGVGEEAVPEKPNPFEWALGHVDGAPTARLKAEPGVEFHYSNAGVAHLALLFKKAQGSDLLPFLKERLLDPIGETIAGWPPLGGDGAIGPLSRGYSAIQAAPREHARFCYLALHKGEWAGRRIVPASSYDFAWQSSPAKADYGAQWWVYPRFDKAPRDLVQTSGKNNNSGFVVPSLDLVFVRLGDGDKFPKDFERDLVMMVLAAVGER